MPDAQLAIHKAISEKKTGKTPKKQQEFDTVVVIRDPKFMPK